MDDPNRPYKGVEKAADRIEALQAEVARLRSLLKEYLVAEEIDDAATRLIELAVCRRSVRQALKGTTDAE